jgi:hypothetical protein
LERIRGDPEISQEDQKIRKEEGRLSSIDPRTFSSFFLPDLLIFL